MEEISKFYNKYKKYFDIRIDEKLDIVWEEKEIKQLSIEYDILFEKIGGILNKNDFILLNDLDLTATAIANCQIELFYAIGFKDGQKAKRL